MNVTKSATLLGALLTLLLVTSAQGATENSVYTFGLPGSGDGMYPRGALVFDAQGNAYGTTQMGGSHAAGIVFELSPVDNGQWTETVLYQFTGASDGGYPSGGLTFDAAGNLYGAGAYGGANGTGVIFELSPHAGGWKYSVLYSFGVYPSSHDGFGPSSKLVFDDLGNLYGTTYEGGIAGCFQGCGTVFELSPVQGGGWKEQLLHSFTNDGTDGVLPSGIVIGTNRVLYGTTPNGGPAGSGVLYSLKYSPGKKKWIETILHQFGQGSDAAFPESGLLIHGGRLYGTSEGGGTNFHGTVFATNLSKKTGWATTVLYSFGESYSGDGIGPETGLALDSKGNFYGTTFYGGEYNYYGTVFKLAKKHHQWTETVLHSFNGADGDSPSSAITIQGGLLYGATNVGGNSTGVVFQIQP